MIRRYIDNSGRYALESKQKTLLPLAIWSENCLNGTMEWNRRVQHDRCIEAKSKQAHINYLYFSMLPFCLHTAAFSRYIKIELKFFIFRSACGFRFISCVFFLHRKNTLIFIDIESLYAHQFWTMKNWREYSFRWILDTN